MARKLGIATLATVLVVTAIALLRPYLTQADRDPVGVSPPASEERRPVADPSVAAPGPVTVLEAVPLTPEFSVALTEGSAGIAGIVRSQWGDPVAGAHVTLFAARIPDDVSDEGGASLWRFMGSRQRPYRRGGFGGGGFAPEDLRDSLDPLARVVTNDEGRFVFSGLSEGSYLIAGRTDGSLITPSAQIEFIETETREVGITLRPEGVLRGRIQDPHGAPVGGAEVRIRGALLQPEAGFEGLFVNLDDLLLYLLNSLERQGVSDPSGEFAFHGLPELEYEVFVLAEPWAGAERMELIPQEAPLDITLREGARLEGRVEGPHGAGLAGATVTLTPRRGGRNLLRMFGNQNRRESRTDDRGAFHFRGLVPGSYRIEAERSGYESRSVDGVLAELDGDPHPVIVALPAGRVIEGVVRGEGAGPLAGVRVVAQPDRGGGDRFGRGGFGRFRARAEAVTDAKGIFRFDTLTEASYRLEFRHEDWTRQEEVTTTDSGWLEVLLKVSVPVRGRVVDPHESPVAGARVSATRPRERPTSIETDSDGVFLLRGLPDTDHTLRIRARGFLTYEMELGSTQELGELVLDPAPVITGVVLDPDGNPLAGSRVRATQVEESENLAEGPRAEREVRAREAREQRGRGTRERRRRAFRRGSSTHTDSQGIFRLELTTREGSWEVRATYPRLLASAPEVVYGRDTADVTLQLEWGAVVSGTVEAADGSPVVGAQVSVQTDSVGDRGRGRFFGGHFARTRADGFFEVSGLEEGTYRVRVEAVGFARGALDAIILTRREQRSVRVILEPEQVLRGVVVRAGDGGVLAGARVRVSSPILGGGSATTQGDGTFEVGRLSRGEFQVRVQLRGYDDFRQDGIRPQDGAITVPLLPTLSIEGGVFDQGTGEPIARARVRASPVRASRDGERRRGGRRGARTESDGRFRVEGLTEGEWGLTVTADGFLESTVAVTLPRDSAAEDLQIALFPGARIRGVVVDFAGRGIAGARVSAYPRGAPAPVGVEPNNRRAQGPVDRGITEEDGTFALTRLPEGEYRVMIEHDEYLSVEIDGIEVVIGGVEREIRQQLDRGAELSGEVLDAEGKRLVGGFVSVTGSSSFRRVVLVEDGRYRVAGIPAGKIQIAYREGRRAADESLMEIELRERERRDLDVRLGD